MNVSIIIFQRAGKQGIASMPERTQIFIQRNAEYMARVGAASDRLRMEKIEKHPKRIADIAAVAAAQAEAVQQIRIREQKAIEYFKELYGIDPTASSFFHYQDEEESEDSDAEGSTDGLF